MESRSPTKCSASAQVQSGDWLSRSTGVDRGNVPTHLLTNGAHLTPQDASQFHVVDAQTFHDHVVVAVPSPPPPMTDVPESTVSSPAISTSSPTTSSAWTQPYQPNGQAALPSDVPHLTGLAFDPSGRWIYVGTSEGVYEWEAERGNWDRGYADFA